jgi:hypothetical protein
MNRRVALLGPQGHEPTLGAVVAELGVQGPLAIVKAGWKELEAEDTELVAHLGREVRNLALYPRAEALFRADPEVRELLYERYDRLRALQTLYRLRLAPQLETCRRLFARTDPAAPDELHAPEIEDAIGSVRALDAHHLSRAAALDAEIAERIAPRERPSLQRDRDELARVLDGVGALLIAGGHVGVLLNRLRLFDVLSLAPEVPLVAWSGGAMVLAERIVLFHDSPPQGPGDAEVYAPGLGLVRGVVPLPHARHRLRLDDTARVALFARRFAPDTCAALDGGERLDGVANGVEWTVSEATRVLQHDGGVRAEQVA